MSEVLTTPGEAAPILPVGDVSEPQEAGYRLSRRIAVLSDPESPVTKSIRALHTHLLAGHIRDGRRGLAVCSPTIGAGCTTVATNLAVVCAQAGINTLLVDANMHDPGVSKMIVPDSAPTGLRQMIMADPDVRTDLVRRHVMPNLSILYSGGAGPGASELLASRRYKDVIDDCIRDFDFTIVDTPALGGSSDARRVAASVRYGLVVARRDVSYLSDIRAFVDELTADRIRLIGSFLTDF
jgi:Mrp family chromosome partitioning ATPase